MKTEVHFSDNILYLYPFVKDEISGGAALRNANFEILNDIIDSMFIYKITIEKSIIKKIFANLFGYKAGMSRPHVTSIINIIHEQSIKIIIVDSSLYGLALQKIVAKTGVKVITLFHNCELFLYKQIYKNPLTYHFLSKGVKSNELRSLLYSDKLVFLTDRDYLACNSLYKKLSDINGKSIFSPMVIKDKHQMTKTEVYYRKPQKLLFVGSYFKPNIDGLLWFINEVLPEINYELIVIGKGFENLEKHIISKEILKQITFLGFVDELSTFYQDADIIIQPVFWGSGMKTKTAEALMFGKPIISTNEGLVGYKFSNIHNYIFRANSKNDFINILKELTKTTIPSFISGNRELYLSLYSFEAKRDIYISCIQDLLDEK